MRVEKTGLAEKFGKSRQIQDAFCKEHQINIHTLRYYLYKKDNYPRSAKTTPKVISNATISSPFLSFSGNQQCDIRQKRYPVTIIKGLFTINELFELISGNAGNTSC